VLFGLFALTLAGCGDEASLPEQAVVGPDPKLLPLRQTLFPTVKIAPQELALLCKANAAAGLSQSHHAAARCDGDGIAETTSTFLERLNSPFSMAMVGQDLYVADTDAL
jgi:glucose/arabinose dehydrogenase